MTGRITRSDTRATVSGPMTLETAAALLGDGTQMIAEGAELFDLADVSEVDSSGLAVLFGWLRAARGQGKDFCITNPPTGLLGLAEVYDVSGQLPLLQ